MKKKIWAYMFAFCVYMGILAFMGDENADVWANENCLSNTVSVNYNYKELEDGTVEITNVTLQGGFLDEDDDSVIHVEVKVPMQLDGKDVTRIGWFGENSDYSISVVIPNSVTSIGDQAFQLCNELTDITIPDSVLSIEDEAFWGCDNLTNITIPDSVTSIGDRAFRSTGLTEVSLPDNLESMGEDVFSGCIYLKHISIPGSITSIGDRAFECSGLTSVTIPGNVTSIGKYAFSRCDNLTSVTIEDGVTSIGDWAFNDCNNLTSVIIPGSVNHIGYEAFSNCKGLSSVSICDGATGIESLAFSNCSNLSGIFIPDSMSVISVGVFSGCSNLTDVWYVGSKKQWEEMLIFEGNDALVNATIHCSDGAFIPSAQIPDVDTTPSDSNTTVSDNGTTSQDPNSQVTDSNTQTPEQVNIALDSSNVQLSKSSVTYNGKAQKPSIIVKNNDGSKVESANYIVSYENNKNVGKATVTVKFSGNYQGTVKKTFNIIPKGTTISKVTAKKKGLSVKWKKQTTQTTGYEIQYSTSSKFKGAKKAGNIKAKTTSKSISKLKAKKKYYVRIRTYKTVKGKKYYSNWSKCKSVITKK